MGDNRHHTPLMGCNNTNTAGQTKHNQLAVETEDHNKSN